MKEKIDKLVSKVRDNFSIINKTLKEIEDTFVFKDFEDELPTVEQYGDGYSIYLLDDNERELPIEYAAVIMDTIGYITHIFCTNYFYFSKFFTFIKPTIF